MNKEKLTRHILQALNGMPDLVRQVFVLKRYRGLREDQIAKKVGVAPSEVTSLLEKAEWLFYSKLKPLVPRSKGRTQEVEKEGKKKLCPSE